VPDNLMSYFKQRCRWTLGNIQARNPEVHWGGPGQTV
jgi:hypothetical protein